MFDLVWYSPRSGQYAAFAEGKLWAYDVVPAGERVYRAKITRRAPALAGAFADVGNTSVLVRCDGEPIPAEGDCVPVREVEPARGDKLAVCRLHPTLADSLVVLVPHDDKVHFAKGLPDEVRRLYLQALPQGVGCVVRTAATADALPEALLQIEALQALWRRITSHVGVGLVYQAPAEHDKVLRLAHEARCDDESLARTWGARYDEGLQARIEALKPEIEGLGRRVQTPEGVELVIDHTEACWVIDVNSKGCLANAPADNAAYAVNRVAVHEALRQMCLRNMTGAVLVDFINVSADLRRKLLEELRAVAAVDTRTHVVGLTKLGFAELTRSAR